MPPPVLDKVMRSAARHHAAGRVREAAAIYQQVLQKDPAHPAALHGLGVMAYQTGRPSAAEKLLVRAVAADPNRASAHDDLASLRLALGRVDEALAGYRQAVRVDPQYALAHAHLGAALARVGQLGPAVAAYQQAVEVGLLARRRRVAGIAVDAPPVGPAGAVTAGMATADVLAGGEVGVAVADVLAVADDPATFDPAAGGPEPVVDEPLLDPSPYLPLHERAHLSPDVDAPDAFADAVADALVRDSADGFAGPPFDPAAGVSAGVDSRGFDVRAERATAGEGVADAPLESFAADEPWPALTFDPAAAGPRSGTAAGGPLPAAARVGDDRGGGAGDGFASVAWSARAEVGVPLVEPDLGDPRADAPWAAALAPASTSAAAAHTPASAHATAAMPLAGAGDAIRDEDEDEDDQAAVEPIAIAGMTWSPDSLAVTDDVADGLAVADSLSVGGSTVAGGAPAAGGADGTGVGTLFGGGPSGAAGDPSPFGITAFADSPTAGVAVAADPSPFVTRTATATSTPAAGRPANGRDGSGSPPVAAAAGLPSAAARPSPVGARPVAGRPAARVALPAGRPGGGPPRVGPVPPRPAADGTRLPARPAAGSPGPATSNAADDADGSGFGFRDASGRPAMSFADLDLPAGDADPLAATRSLAKQMRRARRAAGAAAARQAVDLHKEGVAHLRQRRVDQAVAALQQLVEMHPASAKARRDLGAALLRADRLDEAQAELVKALELRPRFADAFASIGDVFHLQGKVDEAIACYRKALQLKPSASKVHSNLLLTLNYHRRLDAKTIYAEHVKWAAQHAAPLGAGVGEHDNDPDPDRPIRVGYVSPDFRRHSVNYFVEPLLTARDRAGFHVTCYSDVIRPDDETDRILTLCDRWRDARTLSDEALAKLVRDDGIDILVDLAGHTGTNRLGVFARKPAPVQVTYLGYPNTTGMRAVDYRLTDAAADPPGKTEAFHAEQLVRLPHFLCYQPPADAPAVAPPPVAANGFVTFGCFNVLAKVTPEAMGLWAKTMAVLPNSRLVMKDRLGTLAYPARRRMVLDIFAYHRVAADRLDLLGKEPDFAAHLAAYAKVDVVLDPFPYNGTTTTCEALWMGVPVVTLAGTRHAARVGVSVLQAAGLGELVAATPEAYARTAVVLARDPQRLAQLRTGLRQKLSASPLLDAAGFTASLENAYRDMWQRWCRAPHDGMGTVDTLSLSDE
jgi:protein O-GlcNAc transferase